METELLDPWQQLPIPVTTPLLNVCVVCTALSLMTSLLAVAPPWWINMELKGTYFGLWEICVHSVDQMNRNYTDSHSDVSEKMDVNERRVGRHLESVPFQLSGETSCRAITGNTLHDIYPGGMYQKLTICTLQNSHRPSTYLPPPPNITYHCDICRRREIPGP